METYWLHWYPENQKFYPRFAQPNSKPADKAHKLFWPCVSFESVKDSALMQAYQTGQVVEMDISDQVLDLKEDYKSLNNIYVIATPKIGDNGVAYIHCLYTVGE